MLYFVECGPQSRDALALVAGVIGCGFTADQVEIPNMQLHSANGRAFTLAEELTDSEVHEPVNLVHIRNNL